MAKRRCIAIDVYQSDAFLNLSDKAKVLYIAFILNSDDDGFIINPKTVMRLYEAKENILSELIDNGYIIPIDSVLVIKHWKVHNKLQNSRRTDTIYQTALSKLCENELEEYEIKENLSDVDKKSTKSNANITKDNLTQENIIKENTIQSNASEQRGIVKGEKMLSDDAWAKQMKMLLADKRKQFGS